MQLDKPTFGDVIDGAKTRYHIPLYQRTYDWGSSQLEQLWSDVTGLALSRRKSPGKEHFLGTLVLDTGHQTPSANTFLVVDGQQRLTTLTMLLAALRDHYRDLGNDKADEIYEDRLVHRKQLSSPDRFRLWPTQGDRAAFQSVIEGPIDRSVDSNLVDAYFYFRRAIVKAPNEFKVHVDEVYDAVIDGLRFVSITAEAHDNVYAIFESLNNTGLKLTQGDLLRNFYFSRLGDLAESAYESFWYPMQERLSRDDLAHLFWLDMTWVDTEIKKDDTFKEQSARVQKLNAEQLRDEVKRFNQLSVLLEVMRSPSKETNGEVRRALQRLVDFGIESIDPLVLGLLSLRQRAKIDPVQTAEALSVIEAFLVRRLIVRAPHNALSRILMRAFESIDVADPAASLRDYFSRDSKDYATDSQVREAVLSVNFYRSGTRKQQKALLAWLEDVLAGNEPADLSKATLEHVMPQKLTKEWREELADDLGEFESADAVHETFVHALANITLSGYNSRLSNKPFNEKRELLIAKSNIELNRWIAGRDRWRRSEILDRGAMIADLIVATWPGPVSAEGTSEHSLLEEAGEIQHALERVPAGKWVSYGDVADATGLTIVEIRRALDAEDIPDIWRVMEADGRFSNAELANAHRDRLELDGVQFDSSGAAMQQQRWSFRSDAEDTAVAARTVGIDLHTGPIKDFLDVASNRLAPAVSQALDAVIGSLLTQGGRVLFSVDPSETDVLTATLQSPEDWATMADLRVTPSNGLWLRRNGAADYELVDQLSLTSLASLVATL